MDFSYTEERGRRFLVLSGELPAPDPFAAEMLRRNKSEGVLVPTVRERDGRPEYLYDVTGMESLSSCWEKRRPGEEAACALVERLSRTEKALERLLLQPSALIWDPSAVFLPEGRERDLALCYVPGLTGNAGDGLCGLFRLLITRVAEDDRDGMVMAYQLYRCAASDNVTAALLRDCMEKRLQEKGAAAAAPAAAPPAPPEAPPTAPAEETPRPPRAKKVKLPPLPWAGIAAGIAAGAGLILLLAYYLF